MRVTVYAIPDKGEGMPFPIFNDMEVEQGELTIPANLFARDVEINISFAEGKTL